MDDHQGGTRGRQDSLVEPHPESVISNEDPPVPPGFEFGVLHKSFAIETYAGDLTWSKAIFFFFSEK